MPDSVTCVGCWTTGVARRVPRGSIWTSTFLIVTGVLSAWLAVRMLRQAASQMTSELAGASGELKALGIDITDGLDLSGLGIAKAAATRAKGLSGTDVFLVVILSLAPALAYEGWRWTLRKNACSACGGTEVVPAHSPRARKIQDEVAALPERRPVAVPLSARRQQD